MSIEELETLRKQTVSKCNTNIIIGICIAAIIAALGFAFQIMFLIFFPIVLCIIIISIINNGIKTKYINQFMQSLLPIAVQSILSNVRVDVTQGISRSLIESTNSMSTGDVFSSSNLVQGTYKDIKVTMSDLHIQDEHEDSEGHTSYVTIFKGQWMIFDFNKYFKSNVQVWEKKILGGISKKISFKMHKVELEDIEFNKKFKVIANDDLEAFYIITPKMMERITEVETKVNGVLLLVFLNNQLHVGVYNNKSTFNINVRKPINFEEFARNSIRDLDAVVKFIDILELDNDLFKVSDTTTSNTQVINGVELTPQPITSSTSYKEPPPPVIHHEVSDVSAVDYLNNLTNNNGE